MDLIEKMESIANDIAFQMIAQASYHGFPAEDLMDSVAEKFEKIKHLQKYEMKEDN